MAAADGRAGHARVAVLGTGIMGSAMARNLVAAGLPTTVWDRSPSVTQPLAEAGAEVAASPAQAVRDARVVITMLPTADVVDSVIFGQGVAEAFAEGAVWAQMGTIGVATTTEIAGRLGRARPGVMFVDAPVSGSKGPAEAGQLLILASGPPAAEAVTQPAVLGDRPQSARGRARPARAADLKLVVNAYMSILIEGVAEALELAAGWTSRPKGWPRRSRAGHWTRRSPMPSCTRWCAAISRRSSRWSGHSRTWTSPSELRAAPRCRC